MMTIAQRILTPGSLVALWFGLLGGPLAWALHLMLSYVLVPHVCAMDWVLVLHLVTLLTTATGLAATGVAWRSCQATRGNEDAPGRRVDRVRFMAYTGLWLSGLSTLVTVVEGLPVFFLDPCA